MERVSITIDNEERKIFHFLPLMFYYFKPHGQILHTGHIFLKSFYKIIR